MPTLVLDPQPAEFEALLERRRKLGIDRRDEVWDGVLHMIPSPSVNHEAISSRLHRLLGPLADQADLTLTGSIGIGSNVHDYRVPDLVLLRPGYAPQWNTTAALVIEILSPGDESWNKLGFYAAHEVDEVLIIDPAQQKVEWLVLRPDGTYVAGTQSSVLALGPTQLASQIDWPE